VDRKVLIGYDGSEGAGDALALGQILADALSAELGIVTIVGFPADLLEQPELRGALLEAAKATAAEDQERLAPLEAETVIVDAESPGEGLHQVIERDLPLALVVGPARGGCPGRIALGDVGSSLLSGSGCAIAVAPSGYASRRDRHLSTIAVGFDGSKQSWAALHAAGSIAARRQASLLLLAVAPPPHYGYAAVLAVLSAREVEDAGRRGKEKVLEEALETIPPGITAESRILAGDPPDALAKASEEVDLLMLGSRGYGPLRRTSLGGVSGALMRSASCPVLILPRDAGEDPFALSAEG
jgi:nucleotide-binding universal stress UspA family protein